MKYYKSVTLGCKVNTYETQAICQILNENGYQESHDENCDLVIVNTCAVTLTSESKSRQKIRSLKKENPNAIVFVMGCYSQLHPEDVASLEEADIIIGTSNRSKVLEYIAQFEQTREQIVDVNKDNRNQVYECLNISSYNENTRAFLKIQDGCNNFCSYCVIPYTRGNIRSRDKLEIVKEVNRLVENSYQEIVLTGIDMASYGKDLTHVDTSFNDLLRTILESNSELKRLRISSLEASLIDDEFISILKTYPQVARHLHIPLQSGSKTVLERMNRKYTKDEFLSSIKKIKEAIPTIALACDVIVGFPGESEEEFIETYNFIKECGFNYLHVFPYSPRPNTVASRMKNQVPGNIKKERVARLIKLGDELKEEYENQFVGQEVDVIIETYNPKTKLYKGYSSNYLEVYVNSSKDIKGQYLFTTYRK